MGAIGITATAVVSSGAAAGAQIQQVTLAVGATQGQVLYRLTVGTYGLCDANDVTPKYIGAGIALSAGVAGQTIEMVTQDDNFTVGGTLTTGAVLCTSGTAGGITITPADNTTGIFVQVFGVAKSATVASISFPGFQAGVAI